jgi:integrase/recombinase XerD
MNYNRLLEDYFSLLAAEGLAAGTITYRRIYLNQFFSFLKNKGITRERLCRYQALLYKKRLSVLTVQSKLSSLHCFLLWLYREGYLLSDHSRAVHFPANRSWLPKSVLSENETDYFLSLPDIKTAKGLRDKAILELLYSSGMRRAELISLDIYDLDYTGETVRVLGKGRKERIIPVGSVALDWISRYLQKVRQYRDTKDNALFIDLINGHRLSSNTLNQIIREYSQTSRLNKRVTAHTFRHSCATHLLQNGADIRYIQEMLGHASPATTQIYTRVAIPDLKKTFRKSHPRAVRK